MFMKKPTPVLMIFLALFLLFLTPSAQADEVEVSIHDFTMGMSPPQVASILKQKYDLIFNGRPHWINRGGKVARYSPTPVNPVGRIEVSNHFGNQDIPGLEGYSVVGDQFLSFVFVHGGLVQVNVPVRGVMAGEVVDRLIALYGGAVHRYEGSNQDHYMAAARDYIVFASYQPHDPQVVVGYSAPRANYMISDCVDAFQRMQLPKRLDKSL